MLSGCLTQYAQVYIIHTCCSFKLFSAYVCAMRAHNLRPLWQIDQNNSAISSQAEHLICNLQPLINGINGILHKLCTRCCKAYYRFIPGETCACTQVYCLQEVLPPSRSSCRVVRLSISVQITFWSAKIWNWQCILSLKVDLKCYQIF